MVGLIRLLWWRLKVTYMKVEKKLKQGLADLSPLFEMPGKGYANRIVSIAPPHEFEHHNEVYHDAEIHRGVVCATLLSVEEELTILEEMKLLESISTSFQETYFVSVAPNHERYEIFASFLPLPRWEQIVSDDLVQFQQLDRSVKFTYIPAVKFGDIIDLKPIKRGLNGSLTQSNLVLFDSSYLTLADCRFGMEILDVLDCIILVVPPNLEGVLKAYQAMRLHASHKKNLRFMMVVKGAGAESLCEFVYEQFCQIVSQYIGCDLNLMGWGEDDRYRLNPEILMQPESMILNSSAKIELCEELHLIS